MEVDGADLILLECVSEKTLGISVGQWNGTYQTGSTKCDLLCQLDTQGGSSDIKNEAGHLDEAVDKPAEASGNDSHGD